MPEKNSFSSDFERKLRAAVQSPDPDPAFVEHLRTQLAAHPRPGRRASASRWRQFRAALQPIGQVAFGLAVLGLLAVFIVFAVQVLPRSAATPPQPVLPAVVATPAPGFLVTDTPRATEAQVDERPTETFATVPNVVAPGACSLSLTDAQLETFFSPRIYGFTGLAGGGQVVSGPFVIDLWLGCGQRAGDWNNPYTPIPGLGVAQVALYTGEDRDANVQDFAGIEPFIATAGGVWGPLQNGSAGSGFTELQFPGVIPDLSRQDTPLRFVYKLQTPDGAVYGAALSFTLRPGPDGYRPVDIQVAGLTPEDLQATIGGETGLALPFPTRQPEDIYPELQPIRRLFDAWQAPLVGEPGWIHVVQKHEAPAGHGLYGSLEQWMWEDWYLLDEHGAAVISFHRDVFCRGQVLQQSYTRAGRSHNLTLGEEYPADAFYFDLNGDLYRSLFYRLSNGEAISSTVSELDGEAVRVFTQTDPFAEPIELDGVQVVSSQRRDVVAQADGRLILSELTNVTPAGEVRLVWRVTLLSAERIGEPPAEILALMEQEPHPYQPLDPQGAPPPTGFESAGSPLRLQSQGGDSFSAPSFWLGDLFAGEYYLGRVDFGAVPGGASCDRSADGNQLAFVYQVLEMGRAKIESLRWFDLRDLETIHEPAPDLHVVSPVQWSPAGEQIGFFACK